MPIDGMQCIAMSNILFFVGNYQPLLPLMAVIKVGESSPTLLHKFS